MSAALEEARRRGLEFGLLFCTPQIGAKYARQGWRLLDDRSVTRLDEEGRPQPLPAKNATMFYPLASRNLPPGDLHKNVTVTVSTSGYLSGAAGVQVTDNELPALTVAVNPSSFAKNTGSNAATGAVTRQGPTTSAVMVNLTSSDTTRATVPTTVTIPLGEISATFAVAAVDDTVSDGTQNVTITASASGYNSGTVTVQVADNDRPTVPYTQDFSAGKPGMDQGWEYYSTGQGRIEVVNGKLRMDDSIKDRRYSLNEAILHLNLTAMGNVRLKLDHQKFGDETHSYSKSRFAGHKNADLIAVSVDGTNWVKVAVGWHALRLCEGRGWRCVVHGARVCCRRVGAVCVAAGARELSMRILNPKTGKSFFRKTRRRFEEPARRGNSSSRVTIVTSSSLPGKSKRRWRVERSRILRRTRRSGCRGLPFVKGTGCGGVSGSREEATTATWWKRRPRTIWPSTSTPIPCVEGWWPERRIGNGRARVGTPGCGPCESRSTTRFP